MKQICVVLLIVPLAVASCQPTNAAIHTAIAETQGAVATTEALVQTAIAQTEAPIPTVPTETATSTQTSVPTTTPTLVVLPEQWNGTYYQVGYAPAPIVLIIQVMDGKSFSGKMMWAGSKWYPATTKMSGEFVADFGDAIEQAKWGNHPDYAKGDRTGTWIKWTETEFLKGCCYTLGGWYYGHMRQDGTMSGIYYYGTAVSSFASKDKWELMKR